MDDDDDNDDDKVQKKSSNRFSCVGHALVVVTWMFFTFLRRVSITVLMSLVL